MLEGAQAFAGFNNKLGAYEKQKDPDAVTEPDGSGIPKKQWAFRNETYTKYNFFQCIRPNSALKDVMNCVINLRTQMINSIVLEK